LIYTVQFADEARKHFDKLDADRKRLIGLRVDSLALNPYDRRISKGLGGKLKGLRSSRVGAFRIIYMVQDKAQLIYVLSIAPRGSAYRDLQ
jgi:mRNA interferase RelE/StbE